jgi:hypothetical protein
MLKTIITGCGVGLLSVLTALPVDAQDGIVATLVLSDGQRPSGELLELDARGYTLRVSGKDQVYPVSRVAAIEYVAPALPAAVQARIDGGESLLVLRNGQVIPGRLVDIGGTNPKRLTVETPSGQRVFLSNTVGQIYLFPLKANAATAAAAQVQPPAGAIIVPGNQAWTNTGITVMRRENIAFTGTGDIMIAATASSGVGGSPAVTSPNSRYPVQRAPVGALIGRVGTNGTPFEIGTNTAPVMMPLAGVLFLGINDDNFDDNTGSYTVNVKRAGF